jgi:hypothetical protein
VDALAHGQRGTGPVTDVRQLQLDVDLENAVSVHVAAPAVAHRGLAASDAEIVPAVGERVPPADARANVKRNHRPAESRVIAGPADVEVVLAVDGVLLDEGQHDGERGIATAVSTAAVAVLGDVDGSAGREKPVGVMVILKGQAHLLEIVGALGPGGRLADFLDRRQQ